MSGLVAVSLLLRPEGLDERSSQELRDALGALGLGGHVEGAAAWTVRLEPRRFEELFGVAARPVASRGPRPGDKGSPGGFVCEQEPQVPPSLRPYVQGVGVEPPLTRF